MKYVSLLKILAICLIIFAQVSLSLRSKHKKKQNYVSFYK